MFTEEDPYPGHDITDCQQVIRDYEQNQTKRYRNKLILLRFSRLDLCSLIFCNKSKIRGSVSFVLVKDSDNKGKKYQNKV